MDTHDTPGSPKDDALTRRLRAHWQAMTPPLNQDAAWRRLQTQLAPARPSSRLAARLAEWRTWWLPTLTFAGGAACAALAMVLLAPVTLAPAPAPQAFTALSGPERPAPATGARLQVAFTADARMADINGLLLRLDASVVSGPSALGLYTLEVAPESAAQALQQLQASRLVDSATLATAM
ncbi:hypothetical protein [Thermomonas alba]|uniref:hypothetical protein n=1 Tax=Thermomonas alba TaxID=2888525 RepID=UPI001F043B34|nr:hypothetical protein [Thermomonas alba]